jgi:ubiquinone/menaquinone biosynthesis C-methylase UbiE
MLTTFEAGNAGQAIPDSAVLDIMPSITDQHHLKNLQYKDAANLTARSSLHERFSTNKAGWFAWVFEQLADLPEQSRILELGCGPAWLWRHNRTHMPAGWRVTLTDLSPGMVDQARANLLEPSAAQFEFDVIDAQAIPYADASFDAVVANHMLYHVPDRPQALSEIRRVLKPGGQLFAAANGQEHMAEMWAMVLHVAGAARDANRSVLHFGLENGGEQLAPWFGHVERRDYPDSLLITEAEPLIAYAASSELWGVQGDAEATRLLADHIRQRLASDGVIRITKNSGLFVARA